MKFFMTDVFGEDRYSGNQLATFIVESDLSDGQMQGIAHEIHFSETTFIFPDSTTDAGYKVRIFTPGQEVDFAGHPVLGTAYIIRQHLIRKQVPRIRLDLKAGSIPVSFSDGGIAWMDQLEPAFGALFEAGRLMPVLGLPPEAFDARYPVQEVSTGLPHIIVPLTSLRYLKHSKIRHEPYYQFIEASPAKNILIFCPEGYSSFQDLSVRMFADYLGIPEDPATGSGCGCLAGYLVRHRYFQSHKIDIRAAQGYEIRRPSLLHLRAEERDGRIHVSVGGRVIPIASGEWSI